eukprot:10202204-Karenia_brevis.AAC.1
MYEKSSVAVRADFASAISGTPDVARDEKKRKSNEEVSAEGEAADTAKKRKTEEDELQHRVHVGGLPPSIDEQALPTP